MISYGILEPKMSQTNTGKIYINGQWQLPISGDVVDVFAPSDGQIFAQIARGTEHDIDLAVKAARASLDGNWGAMSPMDRGRLMFKLSALILTNQERLAQLEAKDTGKPMSQARADIVACARYFEFYGGGADKLHGETIPYLDGYFVTVTREPHGVTGHIIPWNYPAQMFGRTLAPALAVGNATVLKPAEDACMTCIELVGLAHEAGFPAGAVNLVTGYGYEAGAALAAHPDIDFTSFTGSPEVGTMVQKAAADKHRACVLELGGKSPHIVFPDADFELAMPVIINSIVQNSGQTCSAGSRLLVHESIFESFVQQLGERISQLKVGTHDQDLNCGPLISAKQLQRVRTFVAQAEQEGVPLIAQATLDSDAPVEGYYFPPSLFGPVPENNDLAQREVFGPILSAIPFKDEADALRIANGTEFGLAAGIWTNDGGIQMRLAQKIRCGQVFVNNYGAGGGVELPFGGVKHSGHGREKGFSALHEFSVSKTTVFKYS
jgi:aldehyde dehydrogenase (NAD+)